MEVISVPQNDRRFEVFVEIALGEAFNGGLGADGHEDWGGDVAVFGVEDAGAGARYWALGDEFEGDLAGQPFSLGGQDSQ